MRYVALLLGFTGCVLSDDDLDGDGWSRTAGDCDDLDPAIHPEAADEDADGIDADCDGVDPLMRASGTQHSCILGTEGNIVCEGDNEHGQLEQPLPTDERRYVQIVAGYFHTCALDTEGGVTCWGDDAYGQSTPPADVPFELIDAAANYSLGVHASGQALCWGLCFGHVPRP